MEVLATNLDLKNDPWVEDYAILISFLRLVCRVILDALMVSTIIIIQQWFHLIQPFGLFYKNTYTRCALLKS